MAPEAIGRRLVATALGDIELATDEDLVSIEGVHLKLPAARERPLEVLLRLARVTDVADLGKKALLASVANEENLGNAELRRYEAVWTRDLLTTVKPLRSLFPDLERRSVMYTGTYQAESAEPNKMSERGKIANHIRDPDDPLARALTRSVGRGWPWYGATDSTVLWLESACRVLAREPQRAGDPLVHPEGHGRAGQVASYRGEPHTLGRAVVEAVGWLVRELDNRHWAGLLWAPLNMKDSYTYWRDSPNTFSHRDGRLAGPPVAPLGLQAQVFDALMAAAQVVDSLLQNCRVPDMLVTADVLRDKADVVRKTVFERYPAADDGGEFLADAVEVDEQADDLAALCVRTVDLGMVLDSGLVAGENFRGLRQAIIRQLFSDRFLTPFGLTGRDRSDIRFGRYDYHAQVWGWTVHKVAEGLRRDDYHQLADELDARVMRHTTDGLNPEFVGGGPDPLIDYCPHRLTVRRPAYDGTMTTTVKERPPAPHQAWTVGAILAIDHSQRRQGAHSSPSQAVFEREVLRTITDRACRALDDLRWDPSGERLARFSRIHPNRVR